CPRGARRVGEECVGRPRGGAARGGEKVGVAEVLDERLATAVGGGARRRVTANVAVHLLRPGGDVGVHVDPEGRVLKPLLHACLVRRDLGDTLSDPDDEDDTARLWPLATRVEEAAEELAHVGAPRAVASANGGRQLVPRPRGAGRRVVAG